MNASRHILRTAARSAARRSTASASRAAARPMSTLLSGPTVAPRLAAATPSQLARGIRTLNFGGTEEVVYERSDWPAEKLQSYFKNDTFTVLGYGSQGYAQSLNMRDQGMNVIIGVRKDGTSWKEAQQDGWVPGKTLFTVEEAVEKGTIIMNLLSDAAQTETWPTLSKLLKPHHTLYFSHGFSIVFNKDTGITAPKDVDVILCAPKGSGRTVRSLFKEGKGINSSVAVFQDISGKALEKAVATGIAVGSGYIYETTFEKEVYSDLYGERGCLMGAAQGMFAAQYNVLRKNGHSPSEAFNETCEEALCSLYPLVAEHGMDYMYKACSTTARRGALDWAPEFEKALTPVFEKLYASVRDGTETRRALEFGARPTYRQDYDKETDAIADQEM